MTHLNLPHEADQLFLTDAGFQTLLLFDKGFDMPSFAAYPMAQTSEGLAAVRDDFTPIFDLADRRHVGRCHFTS